MTDYFNLLCDASESGRQSTLALAHLGDAVFELMVRAHLILLEPLPVKELHTATVRYVSAGAQAESLKRIEPFLSETERAVVKRGRNAPVGTVRKNVRRSVYQQATGFEALFGHLYLTGAHARLNTLFNLSIENH